jgi:PLP dependent protein
MIIQSNLFNLHARIRDYEKKYNRELGSVQLLGVSKGQSSEKMQEAYSAGLSSFGENYVQEALPKMKTLAALSIEWHFIGNIQTNKTRKIAECFSWAHSITDIGIAKRLNDQRPPHLAPLNICIEINISDETTKQGIDTTTLMPLIETCLAFPRLKLRGLMAIPATKPTQSLDEQRRIFHSLFSIWQSLRNQGIELDTLSMGMSGDFEAAIAEGATIIRIGTALFGSRSV